MVRTILDLADIPEFHSKYLLCEAFTLFWFTILLEGHSLVNGMSRHRTAELVWVDAVDASPTERSIVSFVDNIVTQ